MVKLFILLLISLNAYPQVKIKITNKYNEVLSQEFETIPEKDAYIARLKSKWGEDERFQFKPCFKAENEIGRKIVVDEFELEKTRYHCKKNYSIKDVSVEYQAELADKATKEDRKEELKAKDKSMKLEELIELLKLNGAL